MSSKGGLASVSVGRKDILKIDPRKLNIKPGWNSRDFSDPKNAEHVDDLARSIAAQGVKQPLTVSWSEGKVWIEDGECRWRAAMRAIDVYKADIKAIPCTAEEQHVNETDKLLYQYIRNTGKQFSPMEASNHFKRMLGAGYSAKDIADKTGLSAGRVSQILNMQIFTEDTKKMVTEGKVSASLAATVVNNVGPTEAEKQLQAGWVNAKAEGSDKVKPGHIEGVKPQLATLLKEAFDCSAIDDSEEEQGGMVMITMPVEWFEKVREALKL